MEKTQGQRLIEAIDTLINNGLIQSFYQLSKDLGMKNAQMWTDLRAGKTKRPSADILEALCNKFAINRLYVLSGSIPMFNDASIQTETTENMEEVKKERDLYKKEIELLKSENAFLKNVVNNLTGGQQQIDQSKRRAS